MADTAANAEQENAKQTEQSAPEKAEEVVVPPVKEMRAVVLTGFGGLKYVKVVKKTQPTPSEGEVLVRVKACGLNFLDIMVRQGAIDNPPKTPFILGSECAGDVEAVGANVTTFKPGDKVVVLSKFEAWAEFVVTPTTCVYKIPMGMSYQDAAAIIMNFVVAYILLFEIGGLQKGRSVLVHSAAGGVGQAVAQLCKTLEDVTTLGVCSQSKHETIAGSFTHLFDRTQDYVQEVRKTMPDGVDLVLDCLCGEDCNRCYSMLSAMGKYVLFGSANVITGESKNFYSAAKNWWYMTKVSVSPIKLYEENKTMAGFNLRRLLFEQGRHQYVRSIVEKVFKLWQDGKIKPVIDSTWALEDVAEAMQKIHDRKNVGKLTLDPSLEPKPKIQNKSSKDSKESKSDGKALSTESADGETNGEASPPPDSK